MNDKENKYSDTKYNKKARALDELVQAKKGRNQLHNKDNIEYDQGSGSDLDDFIEYDKNADRHYREVSDEEDSFEERPHLKKTKKNSSKVSNPQDKAYSLMKYQTFGSSVVKAEKLKNKDVVQQKIDIDSLWDNFDSGKIQKQLEPEYLMKSVDERARLDYQSIPISKPKPQANKIQEEAPVASSLKKRRRDSPEAKDTSAAKNEKVNPLVFSSYISEANAPIDLSAFYKSAEPENNNIMDRMRDFPAEEKTDSMLIEEAVQEDKARRYEAELEKIKEKKEADQSWDDFSKNSRNYQTQTPSQSVFGHTLPEENGELCFYYVDIYEDQKEHPGSVFLFGKVKTGDRNVFESCCINIRGIEREVYLVPSEYNRRGLSQDTMDDDEDIPVNFEAMVQEFQSKLGANHQRKLKFKPVSRNYNFDLPILHGERMYLEVRYDGQLPPISHTLRGKTFSHVIGTTWSLQENFIVEKNLMGPQWLKITNFQKVGPADKKSWCIHELVVDHENISKFLNEVPPLNPPLRVMSFSMKSAKVNDNWELAAISAITFNKVDTDKNIEVQNKDLEASMFSIVRKVQGTSFPKDFEAQAAKFTKFKIKVEESETALINNFIGQIGSFDPDIITVHDAYTSVFEMLLNRIKRLRISNWSKLARLKKTYQTDGSGLFRTRHATSGRLICDTFLSSREFIRETSYSLSHLAKSFLGQSREDFDENSTTLFYSSSDFLLRMLDHTTQDAYITSTLLFRLQIIPLTKHLTTIAGNTWIKSLQNARAERNEMLLIHEFRKRNFIYPDKFTGKNDDRMLFENEEEKPKGAKKEKNKYAGGLVLEPKPGLYNKIILLLDFNSLYPSIIQEYDICFTTLRIPPKSLLEEMNRRNGGGDNNESRIEIEESKDNAPAAGQNDDLSYVKRIDDAESVLPKVIKNLVDQRNAVKGLLKNETNEAKREILDIRQKAIKLIANSMYGCLGFANSRFYAKPIAATITKYGRQILQDSAHKVEEKANVRIIYGDTDSLMIDSMTESIADAIQLGHKIKKEINVVYKCLQIDIDGIFRPLLLLKKKKYAAKKLMNIGDFMRSGNSPQPDFKQEVKGLDMVRRDWSLISKKASTAVLREILSERPIDDIVDGIKTVMRDFGKRIMEGTGVTLADFVITKQLTKDPNKYPNDKGQPHVQVAKRRLEKNKHLNLKNQFIDYVIVKSKTGGEGLGERGLHPDEFNPDEYEIDREWYLAQQIMPPVQRMLEVIPEIMIPEIAECLGLNGSKYRNTKKNDTDETNDYVNKIINNFECTTEEKIEFCVRCTKCKNEQKLVQQPKGSNDQFFSLLLCQDQQCRGALNQTQLFNLVKLKTKEVISSYYQHSLSCVHCQSKDHKRFSVGEMKCPRDHNLIEKKARDYLGVLRAMKAMFTLSKEEESDASSKFSNAQKTFMKTVANYLNEVIKLSRAETINFGLLFQKMQELKIK